MRRSFYWPQMHNDVLRTILGKTKHGTRVIYVPGNHDEQLRELCGSSFGNLEIHREYVHTTLRGLELLVMHGDEFDGAVKCSRWLAAFGSGLYERDAGRHRAVNALRRRLGYPYWSLAGYLKSRVGNAVKYVHEFERAAAQAARRRGVDGIVCGTSIAPRSSSSRAFFIATTATGSTAAQPSSRIARRTRALALERYRQRAAAGGDAPSEARAA